MEKFGTHLGRGIGTLFVCLGFCLMGLTCGTYNGNIDAMSLIHGHAPPIELVADKPTVVVPYRVEND